jgi:hypothetical protein
MIHNVFECLIRGVNNEWVPVVSLENDSVLDAQLIIGQLLHLPLQAVGRLRQKLHVAQVVAVFEADLVKEVAPFTIQEVTIEVVEETRIGEEGRGEENVTQEARHLLLERLAGALPSHSL